MSAEPVNATSQELQPITFENYDLFELVEFAASFERALIADYPFVEGSLIVSLNGRFGSGKTCFLEMFKNRLETGTPKREAIYINAWKNDFFDDPIVAIAAEIIAHIEQQSSITEEIKAGIKNAFLTVIGTTAVVSNHLVKKATGIDVAEFRQKIKKYKKDRDQVAGNSIYKQYIEKKRFFTKMNEAIKTYLALTPNKPLFILVDELDRARPDYAVKFLETLKHFFTMQGVIFVLGVDKEQLSASVKCLYGNDMNFPEYYRKFVHRNVSLPQPNAPAIGTYITKKIDMFFSPNQGLARFYAIDIKTNQQIHLVKLCYGFRLTPRQINEVLRALSHYFSTNKDQKLYFAWILAPMIFFVMQMIAPNHTAAICSGLFSYSDFLDFFSAKFVYREERDREQWAFFLLLLSFTSASKQINEDLYLQKYLSLDPKDKDIYEKTRESIYTRANSFWGVRSIVWGDITTSIMQDVGQKIEQCKTCFDEGA